MPAIIFETTSSSLSINDTAMSTTPPRLPQLQGLTPLRFSPYRRSGSSPRSKRLSNYRQGKLPSHKSSKTLAASTSMDSLASIASVSAEAIFADLRKSEVNYLEELQLLIQSDLSAKMTSVVRKLKLLHDNMPTDGFFNWARDITPLYSSYIAEYSIDADTSTHMLYLLKRPLVRIRYLAKVMKKLAESSPEFESRRQIAIKFRDLTRLARDRAESERERVDLTTFNFDRVVHFDSLQETYDEFDYTHTLHRDYFEMCVKHRSGKTFDKKMVEVFLVTSSVTPNKGMPSNKISADAFTETFHSLAVCTLDDPGRSLLFPQFKKGDFVLVEQPKSRLSSRQAKYEIVLQAQNHSTVVLYCPELDQVKLWSRVLGHLFGHVTDYSASKASSDLLKLTFGREYSFGIESSRILAGGGGLGIEIKEEKKEEVKSVKSVKSFKSMPRLESSLSLGDSLFGESLDKFKYDKPVEALHVVKKEAETKEVKEVPPAPKEAAPAPPAPKEAAPLKPSFAAAALVATEVKSKEEVKSMEEVKSKIELKTESKVEIKPESMDAPSQSTSMESFTSEIMDRGSSDSSWSELEDEVEVEHEEEVKPLIRDESSSNLPVIEPRECSSPASTLRPVSAYETASEQTPASPNFPRPRDNSAAIATRRCAAATSLVEARAPGARETFNKSSSVIGGNQYESFTANATPGDINKPLQWNSTAMLRSNPKFVPPEGAQSRFSPELEQSGFKFGKKWWSRKNKDARKQEKEAKRQEKEAVRERERQWYENNRKEKEDRLEEMRREKLKAQVVESPVPEPSKGRNAFSALKTVSQLVKSKPATFEPTFQMVEPKSASPSSLSSCSIDTPRMSALLPSPLVLQNPARNQATVERVDAFDGVDGVERVDGFEMVSPVPQTVQAMTAPLPQVPVMSAPAPPVPSVEVQAPTPVMAPIPRVPTIAAAFANANANAQAPAANSQVQPVSAPPVPEVAAAQVQPMSAPVWSPQSAPPVPPVPQVVPQVASVPQAVPQSAQAAPYNMDNSSVATITAANVSNEASTSTTSFVTAPSTSPAKKLAPPPPPSRRKNSAASETSSIKSDLQAMSRNLNESLSRSQSLSEAQSMSTSTSTSTIASLASEEKELMRSGSVVKPAKPSPPVRSPSLSHVLRSAKSMDSLPSSISSKSIASMGREDSGFSFLEPGFFGQEEEEEEDDDSDSDAESVHLLDTPEIEQLEMTQGKAKAVMVTKLPSEPSDSSLSSKRSVGSGTSATSASSGSKNSIRFTPLRNAKSEEMLKSFSKSSEESEESDTLAPLIKVKQRVSRVGSPAECLTNNPPSDGTTIFTVNAFTSRWKGNAWETLSDSMVPLKVSIGSDGGKLDVGQQTVHLNKQSALRRGTAVDVQLRQSTDIYSFRLRNSREADALLSACNSAKKDLVERPLASNRSSYTASICSDSSLGTVGSGSGPLSLKPRNKLSLLAQDDGLLLLQNLKARLFLSPRMSKLWLGLGVGLVSVTVSTEDLMTNAKTVTMKQQGFGEAVFSGSLPAQAFAKDGNGIRVYADYQHLGKDAMSQRDLSSNVYYLQLKGEKEVDRVYEIFTTS
ncbi:hypothetical protein CJU89_6556 [Yarrowia sp. B02]|nr:hypothetical protein CJU89_6556 [Yarrowia sp. B02]